MRGMEMIVLNEARVWNPACGAGEPAEPRAVWIRDGRIADVTPPSAAPAPGARADVRVLPLPGRSLMPAFVDAHFHLMSLAHAQLRADLSMADNAAGVAASLAARARAEAGEGAVVGIDFDESRWRDRALPTRAMLNAVSATRAVYARRVCCHVGVANDALLSRLRSDPRFIDRDSGRIVEDAVFEANRLTRPPATDLARAVDPAVAHLHALGITAIHDIVDPDGIAVLVDGLLASRRPLRIEAYVHCAAGDFAAARDRLAPLSGHGVRAAGIKIFSDGSLGGRTAALHGTYADGEGNGELLVTRDALRAAMESCARAGMACAVHAIGDRALAAVLDAVEDTRAAAGAALRCRIEHAEVIGEDELERCARLRVPLVMQPNFVRNWGGEGGMYEERLGRERWSRHNPFATLSRRDVPFVFSSDGMPAGPLYGLKGATHHPVTRERIAPAEAFYRYTRAAADVFAGWDAGAGDGATAGRIEPGAPADLLVLSGNPLLADTDALRIEATWAGGAEVYRSAPRGGSENHSKRSP
jgi:hypothetical protein